MSLFLLFTPHIINDVVQETLSKVVGSENL